MTEEERDAFMKEVRLGNIAVSRVGKGPLLAPIWYEYTFGGTVDMCTGSTSIKARRLRAEGRATLSVVDPGSTGQYRYVTVEGPVTIVELGDETREAILALSSRYLGAKGGQLYTENFMSNLATDDLHSGHGNTEVRVSIHPENWQTEILG
jgi:nitroimidazol reductase NimA-like FMN-containing flavoprotein (pyridoxamine 5'-phosphate oxidase superfamily)